MSYPSDDLYLERDSDENEAAAPKRIPNIPRIILTDARLGDSGSHGFGCKIFGHLHPYYFGCPYSYTPFNLACPHSFAAYRFYLSSAPTKFMVRVRQNDRGTQTLILAPTLALTLNFYWSK